MAFNKFSNQLLNLQKHSVSKPIYYPMVLFSSQGSNAKSPRDGLPKALPVESAPFVSYWDPIFSITKKKETCNDDR